MDSNVSWNIDQTVNNDYSSTLLLYEYNDILFIYNQITGIITVFDIQMSNVLLKSNLTPGLFNGIYFSEGRYFLSSRCEIDDNNCLELWEFEFDLNRIMVMDLSIEEMGCFPIPFFIKVSKSLPNK